MERHTDADPTKRLCPARPHIVSDRVGQRFEDNHRGGTLTRFVDSTFMIRPLSETGTVDASQASRA